VAGVSSTIIRHAIRPDILCTTEGMSSKAASNKQKEKQHERCIEVKKAQGVKEGEMWQEVLRDETPQD
jgi:hypothetical protein